MRRFDPGDPPGVPAPLIGASRPPRAATLNQWLQTGTQAGTRGAALLRIRREGWAPLTDERLERRVLHLAFYLREVLGVRPGARVAIVSDLRPEWMIADLAILRIGATSVAIEPDLTPRLLLRVLADSDPRGIFASGAVLQRLSPLLRQLNGVVRVIGFERPAGVRGIMTLARAIRTGARLSTPRRARALQAAAWGVEPGRVACWHYAGYAEGHVECIELTQEEAVERIRRYWLDSKAAPGDRLYLAGAEATLNARLALYAALGEGRSTVIFGRRGGELAEIRGLRPEKIVAPPAFLEAAVRRARRRPLGGWARWGRPLMPRIRDRSVGPPVVNRQALREVLGGRVRWIAGTAPLEPWLGDALGAISLIVPRPPNRS